MIAFDRNTAFEVVFAGQGLHVDMKAEKHIALYVDFRSWNLRELIKSIREAECAQNWKVSAHWMGDLKFDVGYIYRHPDGAFLYARQDVQQQLKKYLRCPVVNLTHYSPRIQTPSVMPDGIAIGKLGASHLLSQRVEHFAFVGDGRYYSNQRLTAFRKAIQKKHHRARIHVHSISTPEPDSEEVFDTIRWLRKLPLPCGIMAATDPCAVIISRLCDQEGIRIPHDVALLGVNNAPEFCELNDPELSSITLPYKEMGRQAALMLESLMQGRKPEKPRLLISKGCSVVARFSTKEVSSDNDIAAKAVMYIRQKAMKENVNVEDVRSKFGLGRHMLENAVMETCGHSVATEIINARNGRLKHLLRDTNQSLKEITYEMGFGSQSALCRFFQRHNKISPSDWRKKHRN